MKRFIGDAKKRRIYSELLNNKRWLLLRKAKLNETGGLCERCLSEGRFVSASVVHHVVPVEWGVGRFGMEKLARVFITTVVPPYSMAGEPDT